MLLLCYFDVEKEQCGNLPLPNLSGFSQLKGASFHLGVVENCLYIVMSKNLHCLSTYGWWKIMEILCPLPRGLDRDLKPIKTLEDGTVLMIVREKTLASYNPVTGVFEKISYHGVQFWKESIADIPSFLPLPWVRWMTMLKSSTQGTNILALFKSSLDHMFIYFRDFHIFHLVMSDPFGFVSLILHMDFKNGFESARFSLKDFSPLHI